MSLELLVRALMIAAFVALVASVVARRCLTSERAPEKHTADCRHCTALRHPSHRAIRAALSTLPGQRGGE